MVGFDRVLQGPVNELHLDHVTASRLHGLLYSDRNLPRLTPTVANATLAIAHDGKRGETHNAATLHGLGYTVYLNKLLLKIAFSALVPVSLSLLIVIRHA